MKNNYSKRLIDVIEYSREEAARLQNSYIGPEHLMLGIIRDGDGKAMQLLHDLHADVFDIKKRIEQEIKKTIETKKSKINKKEFLTRKGILKIEYHIFYKMYFYYKFSIRLRIEKYRI